jgi:hypothetical protein
VDVADCVARTLRLVIRRNDLGVVVEFRALEIARRNSCHTIAYQCSNEIPHAANPWRLRN